MRAQVMQAMVLADRVQDAAQLYIEENRRYPDSLAEIGLPETIDGGLVSGIRMVEEGFELTLRSDKMQLDGRTIILGAMEYEDGSIGWNCTGGTVESKHRPTHCRSAP
jgi:type IV pilus assembly protein PilA